MLQTKLQNIKKKVLMLFPLAILVTVLMLFLPAGSFNFWQAWILIIVLFTPVIFVVFYFLKHDPSLLERRLRFKEKVDKQKSIVILAQLIFLIGFLIPGLDFRYKWSSIPVWLSLVSDLVIFLSYLLIFMVFKENSYTSRIIEVDKNQKVISSGPYALVRHPMYVGLILMLIFLPFALGSYWALIFFIPVIILIVFRILNEEKVLLKDLEGYREYCQKVKTRLIPRIW